ncbi:MAG: copper amine oxidase N-terminal domain-containing protein [Armatimonadota bacterium]
MNSTNFKFGKILCFTALTALAALSQARTIYVNVDGQNVRFEGTQPQMMGDHIMVPLRGIFEKMGANVDWNSQDQMVMANRGNTRVELRINNDEAYVNGKAVPVQYPAQVVNGSTMVPIRFISESLGAYVDWDENRSTVNISTNGISNGNGNNGNGNSGNNNNDTNRSSVISVQPIGSVIPVKLDSSLSSDQSQVGDKFTATIDTNGSSDYFGLPQGTKIQGHVNFAQAKRNDTPGILGLSFDSIIIANNRKVPITASLIGLDSKSVINENGRIVVNPNNQKRDDLKYVGTGAGAGALIALVTKGNVVTNAVIGGALGYLYETLLNKPKSSNVTLGRGTALGVRFDQEARIRVYTNN